MIYRRLIVTDQSYEVSCHDKNFVLCTMRFSCPAGVIEKINLLEKIGDGKCLQWWGIMQSFAMFLFVCV